MRHKNILPKYSIVVFLVGRNYVIVVQLTRSTSVLSH